ncbi:MAG TPA: DUF4139 domain-containing protein [Candidatus Baltobacteraceae bacterium]|jgi:hypothetical protein|nr:DUF4139 domain-containing protein [Candidatus Baltobacteraceae bacterium]
MNRLYFAMLLAGFMTIVSAVSVVADVAERPSTVADRDGVNLTIYNGGTALVHDRRRIALTQGLNRIAWRDVSASMDATSALLEAPAAPAPLHVLEQNFDFDLLDPSALLQKYVGREVTIVHEARFPGGHDTREPARILSTNGGIVLQYRDRIETSLRGYIAFPASPANFRDRPTLDLDVDAGKAGTQVLDLSYLTAGLTWRADYVGVLSPDETKMSLTGLVTLSNTSGESFENAHLQLVAGNVNVAQSTPDVTSLRAIARVSSYNGYQPQGVHQENYFEYHLYSFDRPTTIADKQTKQVTLLTARDVPVRKTLELRGDASYYQNGQTDLGQRLPVGIYLSFENRGGDLGVPLPAGIVRLYKNDRQGLSQFIGSDQLDHTPRNETARLHLGDSFDVTARKRQTEFQQQGSCSTISSYEFVISNAKPAPQDVSVIEPIPGDWLIIEESAKHFKSSASAAAWNLRVPANGRSTLTYRTLVTWC